MFYAIYCSEVCYYSNFVNFFIKTLCRAFDYEENLHRKVSCALLYALHLADDMKASRNIYKFLLSITKLIISKPDILYSFPS